MRCVGYTERIALSRKLLSPGPWDEKLLAGLPEPLGSHSCLLVSTAGLGRKGSKLKIF